LSGDEVDVWRVHLDVDGGRLRELWPTLSADEQSRADRFHFAADRKHFIVARAALRNILGRYCGAAPQSLKFSYDEYGKPSLDAEAGGRLRFNVSHTKGVALYGLALGRAVGIDVELLREDFPGFEIAERFFSRAEVEALRALPASECADAFFKCWTRKEAYIKARGEGLSHPLHKFTVTLSPGEAAALLCADDDPDEAARWTMLELFAGPAYRAALVVGGTVSRLRCWQWT
jgi:4'-phosphopantetheinyl transferase